MKRFIFIRHGHYDKQTNQLTDHGWDAAIATGQWLGERDLLPDVIIATKTERTQETAQIAMMAAAHEPQFKETSGGFSQGHSSLEQKLQQWNVNADTVAFVGHHVSQQYLENRFNYHKIDKSSKAAVFVLESTEQGWKLTKVFHGTV